MQRDLFERKIRALIPKVSDEAMKNWIQYAKELNQDQVEPESSFYDSVYVELSLIKCHHGDKIAAALFNYAEQFTFNPFELRGAAALLAQGKQLSEVADYAVENGCDPTEEEFQESKAALKAFQEYGIEPAQPWEQICQKNRNQFSQDMAYGTRQLYTLEQELGGEHGAFSEWLRAAYEINEDFEQPFAEVVDEICAALRYADQRCGRVVALRFYNTQDIILPTEIRAGADYMALGGRFESLRSLAEVGFFIGPKHTKEELARAVQYMNASGTADSVFEAIQSSPEPEQEGQCPMTLS